MRNPTTFETVQKMVRQHLADAEKQLGVPGSHGPTPGEAYSAAHATVIGAYTGGGITLLEWKELGDEIRSHRESF